MGVRFFSDLNNSGYGVSAKQIDATNADIEHSLADILLNEDLPSVVRRFERNPPNEPYGKLLISSYWKHTIIFNPVRADLLKVYDARMGKSRYASYVCGLDQYFVDDGFYSFSQMQSSIYACRFAVSLPGFTDNEPPCNEPPEELIAPIVSDSVLGYQSIAISSPTSPSGSYFGSSAPIIGANSIFVYFDKAVEGAISAITYTFDVDGYTDEQLQSLNPIRLLF